MGIVIDNVNYCLGVDVSAYQPRVDYKLLADAGVTFLVAKSSQALFPDEMLRAHIQGAAAAGIIPKIYHWDDPLISSEAQVDYLLELTRDLPVFEIWLDQEQWWSDWNKWSLANAHKITWLDVPKFDPIKLSLHNQATAAYLATKTDLPVSIYTRVTFIHDYAPHMADWINAYQVVLAQYPYAAGLESLTWQELISRRMPSLSSLDLGDGINPKTKLSYPILDWSDWQISGDKFLLPGVYARSIGTQLSPVDLLIFKGSLADLRGHPIDPPAPIPNPQEEDVLNIKFQAQIEGQNVRSAPSIAANPPIDQLAYGQILTGLEDVQVNSATDVWGKFASVAGWVALVNAGTVYLKRCD